MKERLIEFLAYLGMGQNKFEEKVGLSRGFVHRLSDNLTIKTLKKITDAYPGLNTEWLKTGEGDMIKSELQQVMPSEVRPKQLEIDFGRIAEANLKMANSVETMTTTIEKLTDNNTKLLDKLFSSLDRIEQKIDKKGAVAGAGGAARKVARG